MKVRFSEKQEVKGWAMRFNTHALAEVIVGFDEGDMDSCLIKDLDVFLVDQEIWKNMSQAFKDHDIIPNNYNTMFGEPKSAEDRKRGWYD